MSRAQQDRAGFVAGFAVIAALAVAALVVMW
jgi:hypothetical protein